MKNIIYRYAEEYKLDGFRFDLMGLHDLETMKEVEAAVHAINPEAIIYGEGWTMGSTIDGSPMANQSNISKITPLEGAIGGIAVFNDAIRDGLKGSVFPSDSKGYISGAKVVRKNAPQERVGVLCLEDGKPSIVEYYELTTDMMEAKDASGEPAYNYGVILNYLFRVKDLEEIATATGTEFKRNYILPNGEEI